MCRVLGVSTSPRPGEKIKPQLISNHRLPAAANILNREFEALAPNEKMVSDITYVFTEKGWLYVASIMGLFGGKIVSLSMSERITKELVLNALDDAYRHGGKPQGAILHSDRVVNIAPWPTRQS